MRPFDRGTHPSGGGQRRVAASKRLDGAGLPSLELEEWRYSPITDLDLDRYQVVADAAPLSDAELAGIRAIYESPNLVVTRNGVVVHAQGAATVVDTATSTTGDTATSTTGDTASSSAGVAGNGDLFADMSAVFGAQTITVTVEAGQMLADDVVVVHLIDREGAAVFTRLSVEAGEASAVKVLEVFRSSDVDALVVSNIEAICGDGANVGYVGQQHLGPRVWQVGSQISEVAKQATFRSSLGAFGGAYARLRSDCRLVGQGAHGDLDAIYFGDGDQVLDFRTFQDHDAPDTTSNLMFKGVVDDSSRAIYTGLIRVSEQAPGTRAFQTNRNIKLGKDSWAESVPNLEIETDDVRCSHASTVGPIDEEQRFYLETRGVPPEVADQLIVAGFFDEVIEDLPIKTVADSVRAAVQSKLAGV